MSKTKEQLEAELKELQAEQERLTLEKQVAEMRKQIHPSKLNKIGKLAFGGLKAVGKQVASDMKAMSEEEKPPAKKKRVSK